MTPKTTAKPKAPAPARRADRPLTREDRLTAFREATRSFPKHYAGQIAAGMTDAELDAALANSLGIMGGSGGPCSLSVAWQGSGLRIWAGWHVVNPCRSRPLFAGRATAALAREVYGVANPQEPQLRLF